jgi:hypothetical protein
MTEPQRWEIEGGAMGAHGPYVPRAMRVKVVDAVWADARIKELEEALVEALSYVPTYFIEKHDMRAPLSDDARGCASIPTNIEAETKENVGGED